MCVCLSLWPQSQEKEARDEMKRRAKELQLARKEATKRGGRGHSYNVGGGFGSSDYNPGPSVDMSSSHQPSKPSYNPPRYMYIHSICIVFPCKAYIIWYSNAYESVSLSPPGLPAGCGGV